MCRYIRACGYLHAACRAIQAAEAERRSARRERPENQRRTAARSCRPDRNWHWRAPVCSAQRKRHPSCGSAGPGDRRDRSRWSSIRVGSRQAVERRRPRHSPGKNRDTSAGKSSESDLHSPAQRQKILH